MKYGLLPGKIPVGLRELPAYIAGSLPKPPAKVAVPDVPASDDGSLWGVLGNDQFGDCGVAGLAHGFMADASIIKKTEAAFVRDAVVNYYLEYTKGADSGVVLADFLGYAKGDTFLDHTIDLYAPIGVHDIPTLHFAIDAYGFAYAGITVTKGMMAAFNKGEPWGLRDLLSEKDGGHCVPIVGYDSDNLYAITWGKVQPIKHSAWHFMSTEAWAVITGEFVTAGGDNRGINLDALRADISRIGK